MCSLFVDMLEGQVSGGIQQAVCFLSFCLLNSPGVVSNYFENFAERCPYLHIAAAYFGGKSTQENRLVNEFYLKQELQKRIWQGDDTTWATVRRIINHAAEELNRLVGLRDLLHHDVEHH